MQDAMENPLESVNKDVCSGVKAPLLQSSIVQGWTHTEPPLWSEPCDYSGIPRDPCTCFVAQGSQRTQACGGDGEAGQA